MLTFVASVQETGFASGLLLAALVLGLRHGIDWDHIAAISDLTAPNDARTGVRLGTLYALGHGAVVFVLGVVALLIGSRLPPSLDEVMGRVTGVTLLLLGAVVLTSLARERGEFRMRSRWLLLVVELRRVLRRLLLRLRPVDAVQHAHTHAAVDGLHHDDAIGDAVDASGRDVPGGRLRAPTHHHAHVHRDGWDQSSAKFAVCIGMVHGVGAETPTQVVVFLAAANAGGSAIGITVLLVFLTGLFASNSAVTLLGVTGFRKASARQGVHIAMAVLTTVLSVVVGVALLIGMQPALL